MKYGCRWFFVPGLLLCASLSGCAWFSSPKPMAPSRPFSPVQEFIISHTPGSADATGTVSDPEFGDTLRIVLEQEFLSAAGETCRRASLFSPRGEAEMVVMCRNAEGLWTMAPRVWGQGLPPVAKSPDVRPIQPAAPATVKPKQEKSVPEKTTPAPTEVGKPHIETTDPGTAREQQQPAPDTSVPDTPLPENGAEAPATL